MSIKIITKINPSYDKYYDFTKSFYYILNIRYFAPFQEIQIAYYKLLLKKSFNLDPEINNLYINMANPQFKENYDHVLEGIIYSILENMNIEDIDENVILLLKKS